MAGERLVPVLAPLVPLFPDGGLRRGSTVVVTAVAGGATSLALAVGAAPSQAGSWCAAVGWPTLGMVAAVGLGVALERFALVPHPGEQWAAVTAALIDAVDVILVRPPPGVRLADARRLVARARERGVVLVVCPAPQGAGAWPGGSDLQLVVAEAGRWRGLEYGHGYLQARSVAVTSIGRGAASRQRRVSLWLPGADGALSEEQAHAGVATTSVAG